MNCDYPILGRIVSIYKCITSSADFDFIGVAIKYEECRSIQVKIHLYPLLVHSNGPTQSKHIPSKGLCGIGKCLLSYLTLWVACWQHVRQLFMCKLTCSHIFLNQNLLFIMLIVLEIP